MKGILSMITGLTKFWTRHIALTLGVMISITLLITFLWFQYNQSEILKLESRWLIVSGVPLLAALLVGGYIKSFKGFGVELEAGLNKPIGNLALNATEAMEKFYSDEKKSIYYLNQLSERDKRAISRLVLVEGKTNYYNSHVLIEYFSQLKGLKYIEIRNKKGKFVALIPIKEIKQEPPFINDVINELINALENNEIIPHYASSVITSYISEDTDLIEALKIMRKKRTHKLVVLDDNNIFVGLILSRSIEKKIVDAVLTAKENA